MGDAHLNTFYLFALPPQPNFPSHSWGVARLIPPALASGGHWRHKIVAINNLEIIWENIRYKGPPAGKGRRQQSGVSQLREG